MKHHVTHPHSGDLHLDSRSFEQNLHDQEEKHWVTEHPKLMAVILACLIGSLIVALFTLIRVYSSAGMWPFWG